jgi:4-carboxymuconolactone decarboxylase
VSDYLPNVYVDFRNRFPDVAEAQDKLASTLDGAGPLDLKTARLVKLGIAVGQLAEGAVRSNVRKAIAAGASRDEVEQVVLLAMTTSGFPTVIAAWGWVREVLD